MQHLPLVAAGLCLLSSVIAIMPRALEGATGGSWWRKQPAPPKLTAWDLVYRLRSAEEAMQMPPSRAEVQALVLAYERTKTQLESMGEAEKASDLMQVFLPAFLERPEVAPVWNAHVQLEADEACGTSSSPGGTPR